MKRSDLVAVSALSSALKKEIAAARAAIGAGNHDVDLTIHVKGSFSVGEDTTVSRTTGMDSSAVLALLLQEAYDNGWITDPAGVVGRLARDAAELSKADKAKLSAAMGVDDADKELRERSEERVPRKGAVRAALDVKKIH